MAFGSILPVSLKDLLFPERRKYLKRTCSILVVRLARPTSLAIWGRGRSHRRPNRSESLNRRHFASLDLKNLPIFRIAGQHHRIFAGAFLALFL